MNHEHTQRQEQNDEKLLRPSGPSIGRCKTIGGQLKGWLAISEFGVSIGEGTAQSAAILLTLQLAPSFAHFNSFLPQSLLIYHGGTGHLPRLLYILRYPYFCSSFACLCFFLSFPQMSSQKIVTGIGWCTLPTSW